MENNIFLLSSAFSKVKFTKNLKLNKFIKSNFLPNEPSQEKIYLKKPRKSSCASSIQILMKDDFQIVEKKNRSKNNSIDNFPGVPKIKSSKKINNFSSYNTILPKINIESKRKSKPIILKPKTNISNIENNNNLEELGHKKIIKKFSYYSLDGKNIYGETKTNQDSYLILTQLNNLLNFNVFAVFDGHGPNGHLVSQYLEKYFIDFFKTNREIKKCKNYSDLFGLFLHSNFIFIKTSISNAENELKNSEIDCQYSGSTCNMIIQIYNKIICANVGDSRSVLFSSSIRSEYINLSIDHKPNLQKEMERIKKYGGVVEKCIYDGVSEGPYRVWKDSNQEYPGLAVSRSIGDLEASKLGVLPEADCFLRSLNSNCKFIVIASDGIWEYLDNKDVCDFVYKGYKKGEDPKNVCRQLVEKSVSEWVSYGSSVDDITAIIIYF